MAMAESESERSKIEIAGPYSTIESLKRKAEEVPKEEPRPKVEVKIDLQPVAEQIVEGQKEMLESFKEERVNFEQFLGLSTKQTAELVEGLKKVPAREEMARWVDVEYKQEFYTRFTPNLEPRFYTELETSEERALWDARWQLARAAFVKKATSGQPDKYREIQDLELLGKEQMERLYEMPGVRQMMEAYAQVIVNGKSPTLPSGKEMSFWNIKDANDFELFRSSLRLETLSRNKEFLSQFPDLSIKKKDKKAKKEERARELALEAKQADAVAWNLIWVSNLVESADSRYSYSGTSHQDLPAVTLAIQYKYTLHPQERFEAKNLSGHFWGAFGKWGVTQVGRITEKVGFNRSKDEILFSPAPKGRYWVHRKTNLEPSDEKKRKKRGRVFEVFAPECYPVTGAKSFLEETGVEIPTRPGKFERKMLLDFLLEGKKIPWDEVAQDAWGIYMYSKFHKAVQLLEYFTPGKPMELQKEGGVKEWADPLLELFTRIKPAREIKRLRGEDKKNPPPPNSRGTYQTFSNLKAWAVFAAFGGVANIHKRDARINLPGFPSDEKYIIAGALKDRNVRYLEKKEKLEIS